MTLIWPVTLDGRNYAVDPVAAQLASIPKIRQQSDTSREFGESSLNPLDLWRRTQDDWSGGAGQPYLDKREEATRRRFFESAAVDCWTRGALSLTTAPGYYADLVDVLGIAVASAQIAYVINDAGDWKVYSVDSTELNTSSGIYPALDLYPDTNVYPDVPTNSFGLLTTQAAEVAIDICSDGFYLYVLHENGIDQVDMDTGVNTQVVPQTGDFCGFAKGRLIVADGEILYDCTSGTATAITPSTINSGWQWNAVAESGKALYVGGFGGERSTIFSVTVTDDGASLAAPVPAATLPYGEQLTALYGYVDSMIIGTNRGIRIAQSDSAGNLFYGPLIEVGECTSLTAYGKFVYYGGNDENDLGFVGKIDLGLFTAQLVPAYAQDLFTPDTDRTLMGSETEVVRDIVVLNGAIMWLVENHLWYEIPTDYANTGSWLSSKMSYDLAEPKVFERVQIACDPIEGNQSIVVSAVVDEVEYPITTIEDAGDVGGDYTLGVTGDLCQIKLVLNRDPATQTATPTVNRVTVRALPRSSTGDQLQLPLILREKVADLRGVTHNFSPATEYAALKSMERTGTLVNATIWGESMEVIVDGVQFGPNLEYTADQQYIQGTAVVSLRTFNPLENA